MIKIAFKFKNNKPLINWLAVINQIKQELKLSSVDDIMFTARFEQLRKPKTYSQLKYFHSDGFMNPIIAGYRDAGYDVPKNKTQAKEWVKFQIKTHIDVMFVKKIKNVITGDFLIVPKSFSDATKEEMSYIIDWCCRIYPEFFGVELETVEQYKKRNGLR